MDAPRLELAAQVHEQRGTGSVDGRDAGVVDLHSRRLGCSFEQLTDAFPERGRLLDGELAHELHPNSIR
jgi:hypothetical protein